jgi:hypothetical protein
MNTLILILIIVVAILNIMLFFKIWGMTNNIRLLTELYIHDKGIKEKDVKQLGRWYVDKEGNDIKTTN